MSSSRHGGRFWGGGRMRRSAALLGVVVLVGVGWVGHHWYQGTHRQFSVVTAEEEPRAASQDDAAADSAPGSRRKPSRDLYALPRDADAATLVEFVRRLRDHVPTTGPEADEYDELAPWAIRQACERIIKLERDPRSPERDFAQREMLALDIELLPTVEDDRARRAAIKRLRDVLLSRAVSVDNAEQALDLVATVEELEGPEFVKSLVQLLARHFGASQDPEVAIRAQTMQGVIRRLGLVGQPIALTGTTIEGRPFDVSRWKGKVVLIDFWADWVDGLPEEWSNLKRNYLAFHDQGFEVVGIHLAESRDHVDVSLSRRHVPWVTLFDEAAKQHHPAAVALGVVNPPRRILLDKEGKVVSTDVRGRHLRRELRRLLGPPKEPLLTALGVPALNSGEVIERLCDAGEELLAQGQFTPTLMLRPDQAQRSIKLSLPQPSSQTLDDEQLVRRLSESVFIVSTLYRGAESEEFDLSLATAFAVTEDGVLSTSYHVFDDDPEALVTLVMDRQGRTYPVDAIMAADEEADTCLFRVRAERLKPLPLGSDAAPGVRARIVSHPGDSFYYFSTGHVSNYEKDDDGVVWMNVTADFGQGSSGGPVVDACGNVIGQVSRTATMYAGDPLDPPEEKIPPPGHPPRHRHHRRGVRPDTPAAPEIPAWMEPQMIFRTCVPTVHLRKLIETP